MEKMQFHASAAQGAGKEPFTVAPGIFNAILTQDFLCPTKKGYDTKKHDTALVSCVFAGIATEK
ncbi:MAG: hypothetical protein LBF26_00055 [Puniceicoccales bacterium]|nr:hypothetical protein [Puniceicoccales bacterium]